MFGKTKRTLVELSVESVLELLAIAARGQRREAPHDYVLLKETRRALRRLPAVRRKRRQERLHLTFLGVASFGVVVAVDHALGLLMAIMVIVAGCIASVFLSRFMRIGHEMSPPSGYDVDAMADIMSALITARRIAEGGTDEEESDLLVDRNTAPTVWDAAHWLSKKTGLPVPRVRLVDDPKVTAEIYAWHDSAEIALGRGALRFISGRHKTARTRALLAHEYAHWIEDDWHREVRYRMMVGLLGGIALSALAAFVCGAIVSLHWTGIDTRFCVEGAMLSSIAALLAVVFGTIGFVRHGLACEYAADAIAAHLVGSRKKVADFFLDSVEEWIGGPFEEYCPFRNIMHPPMKARARAIMEDS